MTGFRYHNCKTTLTGKKIKRQKGHIIVFVVLVARLTKVKGQCRLEGQKGSGHCILGLFEKAGCVCVRVCE